jgi:hypothetical protein
LNAIRDNYLNQKDDINSITTQITPTAASSVVTTSTTSRNTIRTTLPSVTTSKITTQASTNNNQGKIRQPYFWSILKM